jgi:hypothetical protein
MILRGTAGSQDQDCNFAQDCRFPRSGLLFCAGLQDPRIIRIVLFCRTAGFKDHQDCAFVQDANS